MLYCGLMNGRLCVRLDVRLIIWVQLIHPLFVEMYGTTDTDIVIISCVMHE